jgi:hypothetical protein
VPLILENSHVKGIEEGTMPIVKRHVFGWNEATTEEKLEGLHDWCNILTAKLKAAGEETRDLIVRIKRLENEASLRAEVATRNVGDGAQAGVSGEGNFIM